LDGKAEAHLLSLVCGPAPEGYARWNLRLLADELEKLDGVELESVSYETVRRTVDWQFTSEDARIKLKKLYPSLDV